MWNVGRSNSGLSDLGLHEPQHIIQSNLQSHEFSCLTLHARRPRRGEYYKREDWLIPDP